MKNFFGVGGGGFCISCVVGLLEGHNGKQPNLDIVVAMSRAVQKLGNPLTLTIPSPL